MIARLLLLAAALPLAGLAQLEFTLYDSTTITETPIGSSLNVGTAAPCQTLTTPEIRLRNTGLNIVNVTALAPLNPGVMQIPNSPLPPFSVFGGSFTPFNIDFTPTGAGAFSATLTATGTDTVTSTVYTVSAALTGTGVAAPTLTDSSGNSYCPGATIYVGRTQVGTTVQTNLTLNNLTPSAVTATVSGQDFGPATPVTVAAGATQTLPVTFTPSIANAETGTLNISGLTYTLAGNGFAAPVAALQPTVQLSANADQSSNQAQVSIPLSAAAASSDTGTLTLAFQPLGNLADDPNIVFTANSMRTVSVTVSPGDTAVQFQAGDPNQATFQTGTTAGTITFTLNLTASGATATASTTIAPAPVALDLSTAVPATDEIILSLSGFDNTHAASALSFAFYNTSGKAIAPGLIQSNVTSAFASYYQANPQAGGTFNLQATFPVTGDITQVASVEVQFTNPAGVTTTPLLPVQ